MFWPINKNIKEKSVFEKQILSQKQYNGKFDRVKLYQYIREEWSKTPMLRKKSVGYTPKTGKYNFGLTEFEVVSIKLFVKIIKIII